ncbi:GLPGLI family protein [Sabulilitoribacter arenilitoris]|uniref:GLPGLI family protein n=1 Tax=Wocania arenilitoris TaxID=2044858 RepID=A0AAE3EN69_9FLAO|nr:GLPGLI family protein [Wocania arenilitoris]MCF7567184.1 GLPGLI family protein [Wocania arenilitoris]
MKTLLNKLTITLLILSTCSTTINAQEFQGKAYYFSKTPMDLGSWGARLSEQQKKQVEARLKNRLEKTYVLSFNKEESMYKEEDKLDAISGATDSWGKNFTAGNQYKNIKTNTFLQSQEFYGKQFLVKDKMQIIEWKMENETKQIGQYMCFKATASIPKSQLSWYVFSWSQIRNNNDSNENEVEMAQIEAWYTPQIPISQGPGEYWGLPGLILEINDGSTTILCSKIVMNPKEKTKIKAPEKGQQVTRNEYKEIITKKMTEFRDNRGRRRR